MGAVIAAVLTCLLLLWIGPISSWAGANRLSAPPQMVAWAYPTNYGERMKQDVNGTIVRNPFIVVLHETVGSADSTIHLFQVPNYNQNGTQVSYHALIRLDGTIVYTVPLKYRAFGAAESVFMGSEGPEAVQTNRQVPASVNNFAYHFSLETPLDGRNNADRHGGYTVPQYRSLAWLVRYTKVPSARVTYHKTVDLSRTRKDPRSFNQDYFFKLLSSE
jgi:N-acetyl-anhydromuramyl-L-alanine amidase AmpD